MKGIGKKLISMGLAALLLSTTLSNAVFADMEELEEIAFVSDIEDDVLPEESESAAEDSLEAVEDALTDIPEELTMSVPATLEESRAETGNQSDAVPTDGTKEEADVSAETDFGPVLEEKDISDVDEEVVGQTTSTNAAISITKASIAGISISYGYTGKAYTPAFTVTVNGVKLVNNRDYTYKFTNNTNPGIGKLTITGKGKYTGTCVRTFVIVKCATSLKPNKTYNLIPKNNVNTAVCAFSGRMVNNTKVYITNKSTSEAMKFRLSLNKNGTWKLINQKCDLVVAVQQNNTQVGKGIVLYKNTTKEKQNWRFVKKSDNSFAIINDVSNLSIAMSDPTAVKGTTLSLAKTASTGLQRFYFVETTGVQRPEGTPYFNECFIVSSNYDPQAIYDSLEFDIGSSTDHLMAFIKPQSESEGAKLRVGGFKFYGAGINNMEFYDILYSGGGCYRFENRQTGMVITATDTEVPWTDTKEVVQKTWNASDGQRWKFVRADSGYNKFYLVNLMGTALQTTDVVRDDSFRVGVVAAQPADVEAQAWLFKQYY